MLGLGSWAVVVAGFERRQVVSRPSSAIGPRMMPLRFGVQAWMSRDRMESRVVESR